MSEPVVYLADVRAHRQRWSKDDLAHFHRVVNLVGKAGLSVETDSGVTDEGEPWFVFCDADSGEVLAHFAGISGKFFVSAPCLNGSLTEHVLRDVVERLLDRWGAQRLA